MLRGLEGSAVLRHSWGALGDLLGLLVRYDENACWSISFNVDFWLILGLLLEPLGHLLELLGAPWELLGGFLRSSWVLLVIHYRV